MTEIHSEIPSLSSLERWQGGFPGEHEFSTLDGLERNPDNPDLELFFDAAHKLVQNWQGNKFAGLYLYGTPGTGKTHAAIGLGRELHDAGADVAYRFAPALTHDSTTAKITGWNWQRGNSSSQHSVFPERDNPPQKRNPKTVLIFDEYKTDTQLQLHAAVEAAAQFGGLVIATSNYEDPFKLVEPQAGVPASAQSALAESVLEQAAPERAAALQKQRETAAHAISASLRSRIVSGLKLIEFTGPDRRIQQSFWG